LLLLLLWQVHLLLLALHLLGLLQLRSSLEAPRAGKVLV
jgi:hypothetical protein